MMQGRTQTGDGVDGFPTARVILAHSDQEAPALVHHAICIPVLGVCRGDCPWLPWGAPQALLVDHLVPACSASLGDVQAPQHLQALCLVPAEVLSLP